MITKLHLLNVLENTSVTRKEMTDFWVKYGYGEENMGKRFFDRLEYRKDGHLSVIDWEELFDQLDCRKLYVKYSIFHQYHLNKT